jgi:hypothetical protein
VEEKRESARNLLQSMLNEGKFSVEEYTEFLEKSELLGKTLTELLVAGKMLLENHVIKDLSELFKFSAKPTKEEEYFQEMKQLIEGELGSKNAYIQRIAATIARSTSEKLKLPQDIAIHELYNERLFCLPEKIVEELVKMHYSPVEEFIWRLKALHGKLDKFGLSEKDKKIVEENLEGIMAVAFLMFHAREIIKNILAWVDYNITYISERGDWFKPALHTLIVGSGDCDCRAILICSLLRSIGFKTYLGFRPGHVFPGVIYTGFTVYKKVSELPTEERKKLKGSYGISDDYVIIASVDEVQVPLEKIGTVVLRIGDSNITLDQFTMPFMTDEELEELKEQISSSKRDYLDRINRLERLIEATDLNTAPIDLEKLEKIKRDLQRLEEAEKTITLYLECRRAKTYILD